MCRSHGGKTEGSSGRPALAHAPRGTVAQFVDTIKCAVDAIGGDDVGISIAAVGGWDNEGQVIDGPRNGCGRGYSEKDVRKPGAVISLESVSDMMIEFRRAASAGDRFVSDAGAIFNAQRFDRRVILGLAARKLLDQTREVARHAKVQRFARALGAAFRAYVQLPSDGRFCVGSGRARDAVNSPLFVKVVIR